MTVTVFGAVAEGAGISHWAALRTSPWTSDKYDQSPASMYADEHPAPIAVHFDHAGDALGHVVHLDRQSGRLAAVAEIDVDADDLDDLTADVGPLKFSSTTRPSGPGGTLVLRELSVTARPASIGLSALRWWPGNVKSAVLYYDAPRAILRRCASQQIETRRSGVLVIHDADAPTRPTVDDRAAGRVAELHIRPGGRILSVGGRPLR